MQLFLAIWKKVGQSQRCIVDWSILFQNLDLRKKALALTIITLRLLIECEIRSASLCWRRNPKKVPRKSEFISLSQVVTTRIIALGNHREKSQQTKPLFCPTDKNTKHTLLVSSGFPWNDFQNFSQPHLLKKRGNFYPPPLSLYAIDKNSKQPSWTLNNPGRKK